MVAKNDDIKQAKLYGETVDDFFKGVRKDDFKKYVKLADGKLHRIKFLKRPPMRDKGDYGLRLMYEVNESSTNKQLAISPYMMSVFLEYLGRKKMTEKDILGSTWNIKRTGKKDSTLYTFELVL